MKKATEVDTPDSGYKEIQLGPKKISIPKEWSVEKIADVCDLNPHSFSHDNFQGETFEYIDIDSVSPGKIVQSKTIPVDEAPSRAKRRVKTGNTLVAKVRPYLRAFAPVTEEYDNYVCSTGFAVLEPSGQLHPDYLAQTVLSKYFLDQMANRMTGTSYPSVNKSDFQKVEILAPPQADQRRIAAVLSTVEEEIQQTEQIIETAQEVKQGLEQDLVLGHGLTSEYQEITLGPRTVDVPAKWDKATFSDIANIEKGNTPKTSNDEYYGGDIVWVTPDDLSTLYEEGNNKHIDDSRRKLTQSGLESTSVDIVEPYSVMFTSRSYGIGKTAICTVPAATNQGIIAFKPNSEMSPEYLYHYLNWIMDYIISLSGVSTFPEVSKSDVESIGVPVPTPEHQERITKVLRQADEKIARERERKQKLQELKRGLMQDLLTGKVRTPPDLLD